MVRSSPVVTFDSMRCLDSRCKKVIFRRRATHHCQSSFNKQFVSTLSGRQTEIVQFGDNCKCSSRIGIMDGVFPLNKIQDGRRGGFIRELLTTLLYCLGTYLKVIINLS